MSTRPNPWAKPEPAPVVEKAQETHVEEKVETITQEETKPTVIMSERDAAIHEMIRSQPSTLDDVSAEVFPVESPGLHRMSLPEYFEKFSYDCTRGDSCQVHQKSPKGKVLNPGKYVLRWVLKDKRALDISRNVRGWSIVNRNLFPDAPKTLFSISGGVEVGDAILALINVEMAKRIREYPGKLSREKLRGQMTPVKDNPKKVMMTGNPDGDRYYVPALTAEENNAGVQPGEIQVD